MLQAIQAALERRECDDWGKWNPRVRQSRWPIWRIYTSSWADISRRWLVPQPASDSDVLARVSAPSALHQGTLYPGWDPGKALETTGGAAIVCAGASPDGEIRVLKNIVDRRARARR